MPDTVQPSFHTRPAQDVVAELKTSAEQGLIQEEILRRRAQTGPNTFRQERGPTTFTIILRQFTNVFTYVLFAATLLSLVLGEYIDAGVIFISLSLHALIGFIQERRAARTVERLRHTVHVQAIAVRNGEECIIDAEELVPGDIILLKEGRKVPADARLLSSMRLQIDEQTLTGESEAVRKDTTVSVLQEAMIGDRPTMVFMGTTVVEGMGRAVVTTTGNQTELGRIATLVSEASENETPLQRRMRGLSKGIGLIVLILVVFIGGYGIATGRPLLEMIVFATALGVSAIPESLPVIMALILAIGMQRILAKKAVAKSLLAVETLGSTTVICSDKTGTITTGSMVLERLALPTEAGIISEEGSFGTRIALLRTAIRCQDLVIGNLEGAASTWSLQGDPTEVALVRAAGNEGLHPEGHPDDILPFDPRRRSMIVVHREPDGTATISAKGAVEAILTICTSVGIEGKQQLLDAEAHNKWQEAADALSAHGYRVLAFAQKHHPADTETNLQTEPQEGYTFLGLAALRDPVREGITETIQRCRRAGIDVRMVTGDHVRTAGTIAREIGIISTTNPKDILEGSEFSILPEAELRVRIVEAKVYARISPENKLRIVDVLQTKGEVVAMTGDGVNDAPALKSANVGIAMGSGTEVAKDAADIVLQQNDFSTIVVAVEEGRHAFRNLRKVVLFLLSGAFSEIILILLTLLMGLPTPLLVAQIFWINLVGGGLVDAALAFDVKDDDLMEEAPIRKNDPIVTRRMFILIITVSIVSGFGLWALFAILLHSGYDEAHARTVIFTTLAIDALMIVFTLRNIRRKTQWKDVARGPFLPGAVILCFLLQLAAIYTPFLQRAIGTVPLQWADWALIAAVIVVLIATIEGMKRFWTRRTRTVV